MDKYVKKKTYEKVSSIANVDCEECGDHHGNMMINWKIIYCMYNSKTFSTFAICGNEWRGEKNFKLTANL